MNLFKIYYVKNLPTLLNRSSNYYPDILSWVIYLNLISGYSGIYLDYKSGIFIHFWVHSPSTENEYSEIYSLV